MSSALTSEWMIVLTVRSGVSSLRCFQAAGGWARRKPWISSSSAPTLSSPMVVGMALVTFHRHFITSSTNLALASSVLFSPTASRRMRSRNWKTALRSQFSSALATIMFSARTICGPSSSVSSRSSSTRVIRSATSSCSAGGEMPRASAGELNTCITQLSRCLLSRTASAALTRPALPPPLPRCTVKVSRSCSAQAVTSWSTFGSTRWLESLARSSAIFSAWIATAGLLLPTRAMMSSSALPSVAPCPCPRSSSPLLLLPPAEKPAPVIAAPPLLPSPAAGAAPVVLGGMVKSRPSVGDDRMAMSSTGISSGTSDAAEMALGMLSDSRSSWNSPCTAEAAL
eukprot:m.175476 g.175476  ORF g.175476 m.175476 type:complete len:341 (+) comp17349_c2_seq1:1469-2491(+)